MMGESLFSNDEFTAFDCGFSRKKLGRPEILYLFYLCIFFEKEASKMHSEKWDIITCPLGHNSVLSIFESVFFFTAMTKT